MGIFDALTTAVTGLKAQSFALNNISGNIANSQTTGFKRLDTTFMDMVADSAPAKQNAGSVTAGSLRTNTIQGDLQTASVGTFMAISGDGFFMVQKADGSADGKPNFDGTTLYTRRGDFQTDKDGYLINGAGYYLMGIPINSATGNPAGDKPQPLQFPSEFLRAEPTTTISYSANLPKIPFTASYDSKTAGSELLDPTKFSADPTNTGTGTVTGDDAATFISQSITGGAVTAYDSSGSPVNIQMRWAKVDSASAGSSHADTWNLFYQVDGNATGTDVAWQNVGTDFTFDASGKPNPDVPSVSLTAPVVDGVTMGNITIDFGSSSLTQFSDSNGSAQVNNLTQNGFGAGKLLTIAVNDKGRVVGSYSNGRTLDLAEVTLAGFNGPDQLKSVDGGAFAETTGSGPPILGASGKIVASSLEGSNVDIADEFTKLIVTQQAYSANTRIVTTSNQMMQDTLNMLR